MNRQILLTGLLVVSLFLSGCNVLDALEEEDLSFTTDKTEYEAGDDITLTLKNNSGETIGANLCTSMLQHKVDGGWESFGKLTVVCTEEITSLKPGDDLSYTKQLPDGLEEGTYRYEDSVIPSGKDFEDRMTITTNTFTVN